MEPKVIKRVYFVRHGKTEGNSGGISQIPEAPLSEIGQRQVNYVADRFSHVNIDAIISSPYLRAKETAEAIAKTLGKEIVFEDAFRELLRPSEIAEMSFASPEYLRVIGEIEKNEIANVRYSDEETLFEMETRARSALAFLLAREEKEILVVTHTVFLKMLFASMTAPDPLSTVTLFRELRYFMEIEHTGITIVEYGEELRGGLRWRLRVLNDRAHLG